jgi:hypothetical protein
MPSAVRILILAVVGVLVASVTGCGGGDSSASTEPAAVGLGTEELPPPKTEAEKRGLARAPRDASPLLQAVYRLFPPPKPDPKVKGSAVAIREGEESCAGKTPAEIREEYVPKSDLDSFQREEAGRIEGYEKNPTFNFPAGQIAASIYEKSLPKSSLKNFGFQGCVYALSEGLKAQLEGK